MGISYDTIIGSFLQKITEFQFVQLPSEDRTEIVDGYMKRTVSSFKRICKYNLSLVDEENREFSDEFEEDDIEEIVDIISEGMLVQWLKPYVYKQELFESMLNTRDYTTYSSAELLRRVGDAYAKVQKDYIQMVREYSYNHGDLKELHI